MSVSDVIFLVCLHLILVLQENLQCLMKTANCLFAGQKLKVESFERKKSASSTGADLEHQTSQVLLFYLTVFTAV